MTRTLLISVLALGACTSLSTAQEADPNRLDWLTGCWQSADGVTREIWSGSEDGYYFGYSVVLKNGHAIWFEQMRIDPAPLPVFNAYPSGDGPFAFPATEISEAAITFTNPDHDFPQKIRYFRDGEDLKAVTSLIDDSNPGAFDYVPCETD